MPNPTRCLMAAVFFAAVVHAQPTSGSSENIQTYGLGAILTYVVSKDLGPALVKKIKGGRGQVTDLDKAGAVMGEKVGNLSKSFDEHVVEDRENFARVGDGIDELRRVQATTAQCVARI